MVIGGIIGSIVGKIIEKAWPDRTKSIEAQSRINEEEVRGAPPSLLRLWRPFLGWVLALTFAWEIIGRLMIIPVIAPDFGAKLPPSALQTITTLLMGMLGLGW